MQCTLPEINVSPKTQKRREGRPAVWDPIIDVPDRRESLDEQSSHLTSPGEEIKEVLCCTWIGCEFAQNEKVPFPIAQS